jgi:hypothetical protein
MSKLINTFIIFTIFFITIYMSKPYIFFDYNGNLRPFKFNGRQINSIFTLHTFTIFLAIISHILASRLN